VQSDEPLVNRSAAELDHEPNRTDLALPNRADPDQEGPDRHLSDRPIVLQTSNLTKRYRTGFWLARRSTALQQVSLTVYAGETFGLLGQNGAGKTTLLKTLLGIVRPSQGRATLLGKPLGDRSAKQRIGYLPENPYFYDYLTGQEILKFTAGLFGLSAAVQKERIPALIALVGLDPVTTRKKQLRQYSKGMLQRIGLAQALINDPELVFLDEPMSGLDPLGRFQMREIIQSLKQQGKTIFFNSHVLSDVEKLCDRVAILDRGELICAGTLSELLGDAQSYTVKVRGGNPEVLKQRIAGLQFQDGCWTGQLRGDPQDFVASLRLIKAQLVSMQLARPSLEEFFVHQLKERGLS
jgi:ABC-2 type transport system ATP-binding protein